ncbi:TolC family protein [Noviherbaspirillum cavernae]|uniref:TolC family protein n=1 Tax=Noviherbaspirillum cavernae TaxID=2320862 RepID=A0A418WZ00_9BURK|nr:TolC family protein [Noviherbaspirillum cavernae]RJG05446.1 TolC family protein [Noviherbaspirillum cavernae]
MYRYLLPLSLVAFSLPGSAQTTSVVPGNTYVAAGSNTARAAEPAAPLTLHAALALAMQSSPDLSAAQYELQAVEASVLQANVLPNPSMELGVEDKRRETRETTLLFSQPVELGGKRSARTRAAERGRDAASAELNATRAEVRASVIAAFFDVLSAQERLRLAQESAELAQRATTIASKRVAAGKVSPVEETKARVAESSVRLELAQARSELVSARKRLSATWGNPSPRFEKADGQLDNLPELPELPNLSQRLVSAPALARARHEVDRRQALAQVERSRRIPDVTMSLGVKRSEELGRNQAIVGVSIPLPLFDSNQGNVLESLRRVDKARDELSATEIRLDGELAQAYEKLSVARQDAESLRTDVVPGAQSAYDAAAKGFEFGKFGFLDVLDGQRTLLQAKSQYLRALSEAHRAAADIDRILGEPMSASKH